MASLTVRDIDDADYENLRQLARENNRSASAQVRAMIAAAVRSPVASEESVRRLGEFRRNARLTLPTGVTSLDVLREDRDGW